MTKLLDQAVAKVRELPESEQDEAAEVLLSIASKTAQLVPLDADTRAAVQEGMAQARRGEFVSDEEMAAFFKRHEVSPHPFVAPAVRPAM